MTDEKILDAEKQEKNSDPVLKDEQLEEVSGGNRIDFNHFPNRGVGIDQGGH